MGGLRSWEEEVAVEVVEGEQRSGEAWEAGAALLLEADLVEQAVHLGVVQGVLLVARGVEVAAEAVGAHVGPAARVEGEEGADVVGRGRVPGVEPSKVHLGSGLLLISACDGANTVQVG